MCNKLRVKHVKRIEPSPETTTLGRENISFCTDLLRSNFMPVSMLEMLIPASKNFCNVRLSQTIQDRQRCSLEAKVRWIFEVASDVIQHQHSVLLYVLFVLHLFGPLIYFGHAITHFSYVALPTKSITL